MALAISERALTAEELEKLRQRRPPILFWKWRRLANQEIVRAVGEGLDFEVQRAWNANPCEAQDIGAGGVRDVSSVRVR